MNIEGGQAMELLKILLQPKALKVSRRLLENPQANWPLKRRAATLIEYAYETMERANADLKVSNQVCHVLCQARDCQEKKMHFPDGLHSMEVLGETMETFNDRGRQPELSGMLEHLKIRELLPSQTSRRRLAELFVYNAYISGISEWGKLQKISRN